MTNEETKAMNDLILNQISLEQLELKGLDTHNNLMNDISANGVSYQLKKFNIDYNGYSINSQKLYTFIQSQKSLKEVF